ncbi:MULTISPECIES: TetR/AcrR family transcriptional regulator [Nitratiruptor]|uniref:Transcriptional regulator, TetR family n=1 Tax=Nitratiruptor tergarcus DSM 16512 TaxID=1069081 RepID=A0A1W1WU41_9BACT|nr:MULTISPECIES: TetR/AcrR family transcriptional regulator [Nitratiruptor]BCD62390.1 transcriptional regulator, TetR family [Nitratiruptor sp. YY08-13]BCD66326.1 transcriptional regulator, TetR family [Nitratiruptor sp. YY08-26]SMC09797.1 transcriptional regulator, TetR family [Nitratiruptor tergarcus DSM 16512]
MRKRKEEKKQAIMDTALALFAKKGYYEITISDIAKEMGMSVGNLYNYFSSKDALAKELMLYISKILGNQIRQINLEPISVKEKIEKIVAFYFEMVEKRSELIEYFLRIYLSHKEIFKDGCEGMVCVSPFVTEIMILFEEGVSSGELKDQDFFSAFGLFMGYLGGMAYLKGEGMLPNELSFYQQDVAENIYRALKSG